MSPNPNNQTGEDDKPDKKAKPIFKSHSLEQQTLGGRQGELCYSKSQTTVRKGKAGPEKKKSVSSLVDELLSDIYGKTDLKRKGSTATNGGDWSWQESDTNRRRVTPRSNLKQMEMKCWSKDVKMLTEEISALESLVVEESNNLVKYLKRKDYLLMRREAHCDVITAVIQAISRKTREDMKMKFSLAPGTETGFSQWLDAMKMVAQLPGGVPSEFRTKLWLQLSERHLNEQNIDWEKAEAVIFNEWTNPDDEELGVQIVKDLHRTGCSLFCGAQEQNQALLKRVLLAYARWNKNVGYCQGFNMLAALILQVMDRDEKNAVKVMIYLIEGVLPESYFANNLRGLSVDMAVFRDLLRLRLPKLSKHLEALQNDTNAGNSYEPPLTNVFTMQWFLTLFSNCLPQQTVLRVWDLVFLHGNEVLLRTALAIWGILQDRIISVESADEFYSIMGVVTREMLEFGLMDANNLVKMIVMVDPFPNELQELREKYLYNISPWTQTVQSAARKGIKLFYSDPEDQDDTEDEDKIALATAYGVFRRRESGSKEVLPMGPTLDISVLKQQYAKLRERQRQAHIIISAACSSNLPANLTCGPTVSVNHLLMGKSALINKGRRIGPPEGSIPPPKNRTSKAIDANKAQAQKKGKVVISGETLEWKDAEKRKCSIKMDGNKISNTKSMEACNGIGKTADVKGRHQHFGEDEAEDENGDDVHGRKRRSSTSSASSTSTELCDEESHRFSDFESEEINHEESTNSKDFSNSVHQVRILAENLSSCLDSRESSSSVTDFESEARKCAENLIREIVEEAEKSNRLLQRFEQETVRGDADGDESREVKSEVPIAERDEITESGRNLIFDRSKFDSSRGNRDRRKSDLALSVIKENLEMLSKFTQKAVAKEEEAGEDPKPVRFEIERRSPIFTESVREESRRAERDLKTTETDVGEIASYEPKAKIEIESPKTSERIGDHTIKNVQDTGKIDDGMIAPEASFGVEPGNAEKIDILNESNREVSKSLEEDLGMRETGARTVVHIESPKFQKEEEQMPWPRKMKEIENFVEKTCETRKEADSDFKKGDLEKVIDSERASPRKEDTKAEESPRTVAKVNKEVNTDITIAMQDSSSGISPTRQSDHSREILMELISSKSVHKSPDRFKPEKLRNAFDSDSTPRFGREDLAEKWKKESEKIESKIEMSKSDWDLKMRKIAELENTTREKLNEMRSKSSTGHRHRSLDRYDGRGFADARPIPRIEVPEEDGNVNSRESENRKKRISALSFDEITSRTEKLLSMGGFASDIPNQRKWGKSFDDDHHHATTTKSYEFYSSPTSPEYRARKFSDYSSPKRYDPSKWRQIGDSGDDWLTITEENGKTKSIDLTSRGRKSEEDLSERSPTGFNPFPTRSTSRPKELGVRLGMYPASPEMSRTSKKS